MRDLRNEAGRTMLEMLGVLAIMGVIMYGAIASISFGVESYKINATYNMLEELSQGVVDLYSWSPSYATNDVTGKMSMINAVCQNNVVECNSTDCGKESASPECVIKSPFSDVNVLIQGNGQHFFITLGKLSSLACARLRDMTYSNLCVRRWNEKNVDCGVEKPVGISGDTDTDCEPVDGEAVLFLVSH